MEAALLAVLVLRLTVGTEGKARHGGLAAIVGQPPDQTKAGAAVGTVGEGIVKVAAGGVKNIRHTLGAGGSIDGHFSADGGGLTGANGKTGFGNSGQGQGLALHGGDPGQGRGLSP